MPVSEISNLLRQFGATCIGKQEQEISRILRHTDHLLHGPFSSEEGNTLEITCTLLPFFTLEHENQPRVTCYYKGSERPLHAEPFNLESDALAAVLVKLCDTYGVPYLTSVNQDRGGEFAVMPGLELVSVETLNPDPDIKICMAFAVHLKEGFNRGTLPGPNILKTYERAHPQMLDVLGRKTFPLLVRRAVCRLMTKIID